MGNYTSSIYGTFIYIIIKISEKLHLNNQENLGFQDNTKENLLGEKKSYLNIDIEKKLGVPDNNQTNLENKKYNNITIPFLSKNTSHDANGSNSFYSAKYQLLKNNDDYDIMNSTKNEKEKNFELLKNEINQTHIDFEEILEEDVPKRLTNIYTKNKTPEGSEKNDNETIIENKNNLNEVLLVYEKTEDLLDNKLINKNQQLQSKDKNTQNVINHHHETLEDLRKQILDKKYDDEEDL